MTQLAQLLEKKAAMEAEMAALQKSLDEARRAERANVIASIRKMLADNGLTVEDLGLKSAVKVSRNTGDLSGRKVAPKYSDGAGHTWTGRGLQPNWIKAALAGGKKLEDFLIK